MQSATRYNALHATEKFDVIFGHNFYDMGTPAGYPCTVRLLPDVGWPYCGGCVVGCDVCCRVTYCGGCVVGCDVCCRVTYCGGCVGGGTPCVVCDPGMV